MLEKLNGKIQEIKLHSRGYRKCYSIFYWWS